MLEALHWNHNTHYLDEILRQVPGRASRAVDIGCGRGELATRLAARCDEVLAVDRDPGMVEVARTLVPGTVRVECVDAFDLARPSAGYDVLTCVSTLHHLSRARGIEATLDHLRRLMAPGGRLVVVGLSRQPAEGIDLPMYVVVRPVDLAIGVWRWGRRGFRALDDGPPFPVEDPDLTLPELRAAVAQHLPGARVRRLFFWRYLLTWTAPES